ncbi:alpha/beta fold hydrolase [Pedobacter cryoconitis]|uniref:Pimeloyl-ACP methyl ester carboxylesterase n=1 Tax=Pedobacter cryoconitis TaxID=188932 RepID=A0A7X0J5F3_9SPHI|nr:alpha/beta hydrolase [Pedobacter cryoconitis]MBB6500692.1 pimeloyl-ACP methyl ester carboxylesterase [Pedobacter cryoconitis]
MKSIILLICLMTITERTSVFAQYDRNSDTTNLEKLYQQAKSAYLEFENIHGGYVQTNNVLMHYLTWGNPSDTPLIWAHGSFSHSYELAKLAKTLTDGGYYLIAVDYYGHGQTPIPAHEVSLYHSADDILVLMDSLKINKAVIGGFSRGGYIAAAFYQSYPQRVKGLILEDGGSVAFNSFNHSMSDEILQKKLSSIVPSAEADSLYNKSYDSEMEAYLSLYDKSIGGTQPELLNIIKKRGNHWITYQGLANFFSMENEKQFRDLVLKPNKSPLYGTSITMVQPKIIFRNLTVPMLILDPVSANDPIPFEKENVALTNQFPHLITRVEYPGVEHNVHYAQPDKFCQDLIRFLADVKRKGLH